MISKRTFPIVVLLTILTAAPASAMTPLGTAWTYQGRLNYNSAPFTGAADFEFRLYDAPVAGAAIGAVVPVNNVSVADGLFNVEVDFGLAAFSGDERYLEISVRTPTGGGPFTVLSPRQRVSPTPNAIHSMKPWITDGNNIYFDGTFTGIGTTNPNYRLHVQSTTPRAIYGVCTNAAGNTTGVWGQSDSTGGEGVTGLATAATGTTSGLYGQSNSSTGRGVFGLATANDPASSASGVSGETRAVFGAGVLGNATHPTGVTYGVRGTVTSPNGWAGYFVGRSYFSDNVGIGVSLLDGPLARMHVVRNGAMLGAGSIAGEDLLIEDTDAKLGIYSADSGSGGSALSLGSLDTTFGNLLNKWSFIRETRTGGDGLRLTFGVNPEAFSNSTVAYFDDNGNVGLRTTAPQGSLHVETSNMAMSASALSNDDIIVEDSDSVLGLYSSSAGTWASAVVLGQINSNGGLADKWAMAQRTTGDLRFTYGTESNYGNNSSVMALTTNGDVGIGTIAPAVRLQVSNGTDAALNGGGYFQLGSITGSNVVADTNEIMARNNGAAATFYINNDGGDVVIAPQGSTRVRVLEITGADLAEKFPTSESAEPGTVMMIDRDCPGQLTVAFGAYNKAVAGVVSGANGLPAGAILGNLPGQEDATAIALNGRVWVHCTTEQEAIEVGDLLTTSDEPGHAMKASDPDRAYGAVIGKAMTSLSKGESGMVLVLVNLQ